MDVELYAKKCIAMLLRPRTLCDGIRRIRSRRRLKLASRAKSGLTTNIDHILEKCLDELTTRREVPLSWAVWNTLSYHTHVLRVIDKRAWYITRSSHCVLLDMSLIINLGYLKMLQLHTLRQANPPLTNNRKHRVGIRAPCSTAHWSRAAEAASSHHQRERALTKPHLTGGEPSDLANFSQMLQLVLFQWWYRLDQWS